MQQQVQQSGSEDSSSKGGIPVSQELLEKLLGSLFYKRLHQIGGNRNIFADVRNTAGADLGVIVAKIDALGNRFTFFANPKFKDAPELFQRMLHLKSGERVDCHLRVATKPMH